MGVEVYTLSQIGGGVHDSQILASILTIFLINGDANGVGSFDENNGLSKDAKFVGND